ncbi:MAG: Hsp33 family molecular chaperone HslO, partial [Lachnospiraceae bacterium]|nr:Hsp33 family molecular chaperone HslO [Lachnospiraceae bacterium]
MAGPRFFGAGRCRKEFGLDIMEKNEVSFQCNCSTERIEKA